MVFAKRSVSLFSVSYLEDEFTRDGVERFNGPATDCSEECPCCAPCFKISITNHNLGVRTKERSDNMISKSNSGLL